MEISVKTVAMIALSLIIIAGIYAVVSTQFGSGGEEIEGTSENAGNAMDCVLNNMESGAEDCKDEELAGGSSTEESSFEVQNSHEVAI